MRSSTFEVIYVLKLKVALAHFGLLHYFQTKIASSEGVKNFMLVMKENSEISF